MQIKMLRYKGYNKIKLFLVNFSTLETPVEKNVIEWEEVYNFSINWWDHGNCEFRRGGSTTKNGVEIYLPIMWFYLA